MLESRIASVLAWLIPFAIRFALYPLSQQTQFTTTPKTSDLMMPVTYYSSGDAPKCSLPIHVTWPVVAISISTSLATVRNKILGSLSPHLT